MSWPGWTGTAVPPTGYINAEGGGAGIDSAVAYKAVASPGVEDPGPYSGGSTSGLDEVGEITVALKPATAARVRHRVMSF